MHQDDLVDKQVSIQEEAQKIYKVAAVNYKREESTAPIVAISLIDNARDLAAKTKSILLHAKDSLIDLGWREIKYVEGVNINIYMVHPDLVKQLRYYHVHIDDCFMYFNNQSNHQVSAQRIINNNTHLWVKLPHIYGLNSHTSNHAHFL